MFCLKQSINAVNVLREKVLIHMQKFMSLEELAENFSFFENWEEKYSYLIDLGKKVEPLNDVYKVDVYKVDGCTSNVWLVPDSSGECIVFQADSDALIVRGLIMILFCAYYNKTKEEVAKIDIEAFFTRIGMNQHLSPNRRNGFFAMVEKIKVL